MALKTLDRYQIISELGEGSTGVVYKALDPILERVLAIKTVNPKLPEEDLANFRIRFLREAKSAGRLNHPNITTVYDAGRADNITYLAMELLEGQNLRDVLTGGIRLDIDVAIDITCQVADGLAHAHKNGVVHRDIKPSNIIVQANQTVKITDFGVAKISSTSLTLTGVVLGSPKYMAPEQVSGVSVDDRADIFSLGIVLYEMLAGRNPFDSDSVYTTLYRIVNETPEDIRTVNPDVPDALRAVLKKSLAKDPMQRYPKISLMADDLRNLAKKLKGISKEQEAASATPEVVAAPVLEQEKLEKKKPRAAQHGKRHVIEAGKHAKGGKSDSSVSDVTTNLMYQTIDTEKPPTDKEGTDEWFNAMLSEIPAPRSHSKLRMAALSLTITALAIFIGYKVSESEIEFSSDIPEYQTQQALTPMVADKADVKADVKLALDSSIPSTLKVAENGQTPLALAEVGKNPIPSVQTEKAAADQNMVLAIPRDKAKQQSFDKPSPKPEQTLAAQADKSKPAAQPKSTLVAQTIKVSDKPKEKQPESAAKPQQTLVAQADKALDKAKDKTTDKSVAKPQQTLVTQADKTKEKQSDKSAAKAQLAQVEQKDKKPLTKSSKEDSATAKTVKQDKKQVAKSTTDRTSVAQRSNTKQTATKSSTEKQTKLAKRTSTQRKVAKSSSTTSSRKVMLADNIQDAEPPKPIAPSDFALSQESLPGPPKPRLPRKRDLQRTASVK